MPPGMVGLASALCFSALLHAWLLAGFSVGAPGVPDRQVSVLRARLEAAGPRVGDGAPAPSEFPTYTPKAITESTQADRLPTGAAVGRETQPLASPVDHDLMSSSQPPATDTPAQFVVAAEYDARPPLPAPLIVDATVYPPQELDVFPLPLEPVSPSLPADAHSAAPSGRVMLELVVDEHGAVRDARVVEAQVPRAYEEAALESFRMARFSPAQREGRAVRARIAIEVEFTAPPDSRQAR